MSVTKRILVTGRVHGVGYRDWTIREAKKLGLAGFVRNCGDGRVEIFAMGEDGSVDMLVDACRHGPPLARVDHVESATVADMRVKGFTKRFAT